MKERTFLAQLQEVYKKVKKPVALRIVITKSMAGRLISAIKALNSSNLFEKF